MQVSRCQRAQRVPCSTIRTIKAARLKSEEQQVAHLPLHSDGDLPSLGVQGVEPALHEKSPLEAEGSDQEVESHSAEAVAFEEGHEEAESNKDHHVDILET